jgi:hypothetical protein
MFYPLPETTPETYLTGQTALNIRSEEGTGDWHFLPAFESGYFMISGKNMISTKELLGKDGIFDCAETLRKQGIPSIGPVYSASHYRAVADMVLDMVVGHGWTPQGVIILEDWFPAPQEKQRVRDMLEKARPKITTTQWKIIAKWLNTQTKTD